MPSLFAQSELSDLIVLVENGRRLDFEAGMRMMESKDILSIGYMADFVRKQKNGSQAYFLDDTPSDPCNSLEATMVYFNNQPATDRIDNLLKLRELQDQTNRFLTFSPVPKSLQEPNQAGYGVVETTTGFDDLKILAVARILLDNFQHITVSWPVLGAKLAQVSLNFGADDLKLNEAMSRNTMIHLIQKAGRDAVERDPLFRTSQKV